MFPCPTRAETQHAIVKRFLGSGVGSLDTVFEKMHARLELTIVEVKASLERSRTEVEHEIANMQCFRYLQRNCSMYALDIMRSSYEAVAKGDTGDCDCKVPITHGLPCGHQIATYVRGSEAIRLSAIHPMWKTLHLLEANEEQSEMDAIRRYEDETKAKFDRVFPTLTAERRRHVIALLDNFLHPGKLQ